MILMSVLFPAPFSPTSACTSPRRRVKSTPSSAVAPAKRLTMDSMRRMGSGGGAGFVMAGVRKCESAKVRKWRRCEARISYFRTLALPHFRTFSVRFLHELRRVGAVEEAVGDQLLRGHLLALAHLLDRLEGDGAEAGVALHRGAQLAALDRLQGGALA